MSITNFSLPSKPEEDIQENRNNYSSFCTRKQTSEPNYVLTELAEAPLFYPEKRHPCRFIVDREVNIPEKRCPHRSLVTRVFRYHMQIGKEIKRERGLTGR